MTQTPSNQADKAHALLIGVDDYRSFDRSGRSDLKGSRNDVLLLASYCVEVLGMRPENIVALTTPMLTAQDFEQHVSMRGIALGDAIRGIAVGDASKEEVKKRLASLLDFSQGGTALLTFSGHGAAAPDVGPVLCLGDTSPDFKSGVLPLETLREDIKDAYAERRLIALLDCCHVAAPRPHPRLQGTSLRHTVATENVMKQEDLFRVSDRVLLAARPGMPAYQMRFGKLWHGALTFALVTAAERWQGENEVSHGSYKHVLKRAKGTLKALGVPQKSELRVLPQGRETIRKSPFLGVKPGPTQPKPDAKIIGLQLDPDFYYTIYVDSHVLTQTVAVGDTEVWVILDGSPTPLDLPQPDAERWYVNNTLLGAGPGQLGDIKEITVETLKIPATKPQGPYLWLGSNLVDDGSCPEALDWSNELKPPSGTNVTNYVFKGEPTAPAKTTLCILFSVTATTTGATTTYALTEVQWYLFGHAERPSPTSGLLQPGSSPPITYSLQPDWSPQPSYWAATSAPSLTTTPAGGTLTR